jgi:hypothetical protein
MATTKLTLSVEIPLIEEAKRLAAERHTSVSAMFARFLRSVTAPDPRCVPSLGPITRKASGIARLPTGRSDRDLLEDALLDRYGARK